eukprot:2481724-Pyramimonas_sp.AAC.2
MQPVYQITHPPLTTEHLKYLNLRVSWTGGSFFPLPRTRRLLHSFVPHKHKALVVVLTSLSS